MGRAQSNIEIQHFTSQFIKSGLLSGDELRPSPAHFERQNTLFRQYAEDNNFLISSGIIGDLETFYFGGGQEYQIFHPADGQRIFKLTRKGKWGPSIMLIDYLVSISALNLFNPELDTRFAGVFLDDKFPRILISQNFIAGEHPHAVELMEYLRLRGWRKTRINEYQHANGYVIFDAHPGNFIKTSTGELYPIDVHFSPETASHILFDGLND